MLCDSIVHICTIKYMVVHAAVKERVLFLKELMEFSRRIIMNHDRVLISLESFFIVIQILH